MDRKIKFRAKIINHDKEILDAMFGNVSYDCVIGIDPGSNGGIAVWKSNDPKIETIKMPENLADLRVYLQHIKSIRKAPIVFIEKVQLRSDDVNQNPGKAFRIQQLLISFQKLKDYIEVERVPFIEVHPITWQKFLKLRKEREEKKDRKNRYKAAAGHYYPTVKPALWNADAILIMHFGRLKLRNEPSWVTENIKTDFLQNSTRLI